MLLQSLHRHLDQFDGLDLERRKLLLKLLFKSLLDRGHNLARIIDGLPEDDGGRIGSLEGMVHLQRLVLRPEVAHTDLEIGALEGPVHADARVGAGDGPGNRFGAIAGVLAVLEIDAYAVARQLLGRVVGDIVVKGGAHRPALVHGNAGTQDRQDIPPQEGGIHLRGAVVHPVFLRPERQARKQGEKEEDQ